MRLSNYRFGHVDVNGHGYDTDLIVLGDWIHDWWRESGHRVVPGDLEELVPRDPRLIVFGRGASGRMKLTEAVEQFLQERRIEFEALRTDEAVRRYNELAEDNPEVVAGAFHLTC